MSRVALLLFIASLGLLGGYVAHAQLTSTEPVTITINPEYPRPYQIVTVTPQSSTIDLSASTVTISANGTVVQQGTGGEGASVAMGGAGSVTTIKVTAVNNGQTYSKSMTIRPADVALIVEPDTTTHPFYEGGALVSGEGRIRLIAVPDLRTAGGTQISPASLVYSWKNGDQVLQGSSGIGKSVLSATAPIRYRSSVITLTVSTQDQSVVGQASILISPTDPSMRIYENDPLLGPRFDTALPESLTLSQSEDTYRAVPYFFNTTPPITWSVNGAQSQTGQDITVRPTGSGSGSAQLSASANTGGLGQSAEAGMLVNFGSATANIFGL